MNPVIRIHNLWKEYGSKIVLKGINLEIEEGQFLSILGPNGAGKTTLIKCLIGLASCSRGLIEILGMNITEHLREIKGRIGVVHQENNLDVYLDVWENLLTYGYMLDMGDRELKNRIPEILHFMGIDRSMWKEKVENLSGGTKRKLMIARALLNDPHILIMDEPTTGLDPSIRRLLWDRILSLKDRKITLILTTHYMEEAHYLSDRVIVMDGGRIIADGHPEELVKKHLPPFAVELSPPINGMGDKYMEIRSGDTSIVYTNNPDEIISLVKEKNLRRIHIRNSSLEDVFLILTGKRL